MIGAFAVVAFSHLPLTDHSSGAAFGESSHSDHVRRFEMIEHVAQMSVARLEQRPAPLDGEFVRSMVAARSFKEQQWAVIDDEVILEKSIGRFETILKKRPKSTPADFATGGIQALDRVFGMFIGGPADRQVFKPEPVPNGLDLAEGHAGLSHAPRPGIHAEEDDAFGSGAEPLEIGAMNVPRVIQWVIHMGDRLIEMQWIGLASEATGRVDKRVISHQEEPSRS